VYRSAKTALEKAKRDGYTDVEVHITAHGMTIAEVRAEFAKLMHTTPMDGSAVRRLVIWCTDGTYIPRLLPITPPVRPETGDEERKDAVPAGGAP
jgi:hypothetical protein